MRPTFGGGGAIIQVRGLLGSQLTHDMLFKALGISLAHHEALDHAMCPLVRPDIQQSPETCDHAWKVQCHMEYVRPVTISEHAQVLCEVLYVQAPARVLHQVTPFSNALQCLKQVCTHQERLRCSSTAVHW